MSIPSDSVGLNLFEAALLVCFFQAWCQSLLCSLVCLRGSLQLLLLTLGGREGPSESGKFQGLLRAI